MSQRICRPAYTAALGTRCPNCYADAGQHCKRPDGYIRRIPCVKRIKVTDDATKRVIHIDFTEPRHQTQRHEQ